MTVNANRGLTKTVSIGLRTGPLGNVLPETARLLVSQSGCARLETLDDVLATTTIHDTV